MNTELARKTTRCARTHDLAWLMSAILVLGLTWGSLPAAAQETHGTEAAPSPDANTQEQSPAKDETQNPTSTDAAPPESSSPESQAPLADKNRPETKTVPVTVSEKTPARGDVTVLDSIEVTADKRVKAQRDIPGSVGAIRGADLEQMRAQSMKDYLKLIPGVSFVERGNDTSVPIIRGIASEIGFGFTGQATGIYLDDMPFADLTGPQSLPDLNPFDLERVEVLKGPQGTLFGSGALAGAVRYITQRPKHSVWDAKVFETFSDTRLGGGRAQVTAGEVNAPLFGDAVAIRAVGVYRKTPGLYDMSATDTNGNSLRDDPNADKLKQASGRVLASWNPVDDLKLSAFYFLQKTHTDDAATADQAQTPSGNFAPFASPRDYDFGGGNLLATYDLSWAHLLSSTNRMTKHTYGINHQEFVLGLEQQNQNEFYNQLIGDVSGYTQELRLSSPEGGDFSDWNWVAGASYMKYKSFVFQYEPEAAPRGTPPPSSPDQVSTSQRAQSFLFATIGSDATEQALFGEATRRLGEHWELTAGARKFKTKLVADTVVSGAQIVALTQKSEDDEHFEPESSGLDPKVSLRYLHNRNVQWYVLAAKGFQFGGVQLNPPLQVFVTSSENAGYHFAPYKSSSLWNYESGIRTEWLDRRLRFDIGLFYLDWKDLQLTVQVPVTGTNANFGVIANVGRAHSEGVEISLDVIPFTGAKWTSSAAWITAVTDVLFDKNASDGGVKPGTRLPGTPRFAWSNVISYEHALPYFNSWSFGPVLTHSHIGESSDGIRPSKTHGTIGGYDTFDVRLALSKVDSRFLPELSLGVNNLTDVRAITSHSQFTSPTSGKTFDFYHFVQPRTAVLSLSMKY